MFGFKITHKWAVEVGTAIVQNVGAKIGGPEDDSFPHIAASAEVETQPICGVRLFSMHYCSSLHARTVQSFQGICLQRARSLTEDLMLHFKTHFVLFWSVYLISGSSCPFHGRTFFFYNCDSFLRRALGNFKIEPRRGNAGFRGGLHTPCVECHNSRWRVRACSSSGRLSRTRRMADSFCPHFRQQCPSQFVVLPSAQLLTAA